MFLILSLPFIILIFTITTGPIFYPKYWNNHYSKISIFLSILIILYYTIYLNNFLKPLNTLIEYIQFILLISALYIFSGGILIKINKKNSPIINLFILILGGFTSNLIGTTGASMIFIRPYIKINKKNIKSYHIIFFIFIISNIGGSLTPIGDPPLLLGFLKGVPFFWTIRNNFLPWIITLTILGILFYIIELKNNKKKNIKNIKLNYIKYKKPYILIYGKKNFIWLLLIITYTSLENQYYFFFFKEIVIILLILIVYKYKNKHIFKKNRFNFKPIKEIGILFLGIFITMLPVLEITKNLIQYSQFTKNINYNTLYWSTGALSGLLDNAPTYINLLNASMSIYGGNINNIENVKAYTKGIYSINNILELKAISISSVFFGAMTYIGNGPNFIIKSISEQLGIKMPSFFEYILYFSIPFLIPTLIIIWLLFFILL